MHDGPVAVNIVALFMRLADQHTVGSRGGAGTDAEQDI
jgi:hypothetical protein